MQIIVPPDTLPITAEAIAARWHISNPDSPAITSLIEAAVAYVETATARPIVPRTMRFDLPEGEWSEWWVPVAPVIGFADLAATGSVLRAFSEPRIRRADLAGDTVDLRVGYEVESAIPQQLVQAVMMIATEWRDADISVGEAVAAPQVSIGALRLIKQVRYRRPRECR